MILVDRGLAPSRERARALILAGQVTVDGQVIDKAGAAIAPDARVALVTPDHPYVGRGGVKLAHALDVFHIDPSGRRALDVGASTGGFTDVLLQRGAASVIALDVGRGQLDWRLRTDARVIVREGVNARALTSRRCAARGRRGDDRRRVHLAATDSAVAAAVSEEGADVVALVKPQFEAGRDEVGKHGLVTDPSVHEAVLARVTDAAGAAGFRRDRHDAIADYRRHRQSGILPAPAMNVVVFGAGAIGSVYAAKLSAHHPVTVIGRPDHVAAIARDGLRVIGRESFTAPGPRRCGPR